MATAYAGPIRAHTWGKRSRARTVRQAEVADEDFHARKFRVGEGLLAAACRGHLMAVTGGLEVIVDALQRQRVGRHVPDLCALAQNAQVGHALTALEARAPEARRAPRTAAPGAETSPKWP
jgi:hypothetical protein